MADRVTAHIEQVRLLFDAKAATWSVKYAPDGRLTGRLTRLGDAAGYHVLAGGRVLDLGCGTGELARHLATVGLRVTGCDISPQMLDRAAAADPANAVSWTSLPPGWRSLPFDSASFDAVIASSVLEYADSPVAVLGECARMLRPGGVLLCTVPDLTHPARWLEWAAGLAARVPSIRIAGQCWPRLGRYLAYLNISRQRHTSRWWDAAASRAGLITLPRPADDMELTPLRLLTFKRRSFNREDV
jgi:SAM-dependent methyltransferase